MTILRGLLLLTLLGACGVPRTGLGEEGGDSGLTDATRDVPSAPDGCVPSPGAAERCNDLDDDCDGRVDEDATDGTLQYRDADGDSSGDPASSLRACAPIPGYVDDGDDCDDGNDARHPGAIEICNDLDDDCDLDIDEDAGTLWYADVDGDGFGDPATGTQACAAPAGFVADMTDCDDGCALCYPGFGGDVCGDSADNDCDGRIDADCQCVLATADSGQYLVCENVQLSWDEARAYCMARGGDLVSVDSADEQMDVWALIARFNQDFWLGGRDVRRDGTWRWVTGDPLARCDGPDSSDCTCATYCNFRNDRPNGSDQHCLWMDKNQSGRWDDRACTDSLRVLCEL